MTGHMIIKVGLDEDGREEISVDTELHHVSFSDKIGILDSVQKALQMTDEETVKALALKKLFYKAETVTIDKTELNL